MHSGDLKWASDVIGDPNAMLEKIKVEGKGALSALSDRKDLANGVDEVYATQIANLVKVVAKVHGLPAARKIQSEALTFLDSPIIRNALNAR